MRKKSGIFGWRICGRDYGSSAAPPMPTGIYAFIFALPAGIAGHAIKVVLQYNL